MKKSKCRRFQKTIYIIKTISKILVLYTQQYTQQQFQTNISYKKKKMIYGKASQNQFFTIPEIRCRNWNLIEINFWHTNEANDIYSNSIK